VNYSTAIDVAILVALAIDIALNTMSLRRLKRLEVAIKRFKTSFNDPTLF